MSRETASRRLVLTGVSGAGKTSIIDRLSALGYQTLPEAARVILERSQVCDSAKFSKTEQLTFQTYAPTQPQVGDGLAQNIVISRTALEPEDFYTA